MHNCKTLSIFANRNRTGKPMRCLRKILPIILWLTFINIATAQSTLTVTGRVTDKETGRAIVAASVSDVKGLYATVTNEDGTFILRVPSTVNSIMVSHIGYATRRITATGKSLSVKLSPTTVMLGEVLAMRPEDMLRAAIKHIPDNYAAQPVLQKCFYRETTRKGNRYIYVAEAITDMYHKPYVEGVSADRVAIVKARRLVSTNVRDTLGAKLIGGPTSPLTFDVMKSPDLMLYDPLLSFYEFKMTPAPNRDGQAVMKVTVTPKASLKSQLPYAFLCGDFYIATSNLSVVHADLWLDISDKRKATEAMLFHKPLGVRFKPLGMEVLLSYETDITGRLSLSYIRSETSFRCEWKRKLFASPYHVVSEMVVTGEQTDSIRPIKSRDSFKLHESLYDHPEYFGDPNFWEQYNIIAPSESLERGIGKLRKKIIEAGK